MLDLSLALTNLKIQMWLFEIYVLEYVLCRKSFEDVFWLSYLHPTAGIRNLKPHTVKSHFYSKIEEKNMELQTYLSTSGFYVMVGTAADLQLQKKNK